MTEAHRPVVIIVGAGFGGLFAARALSSQPVDVLLIDRNNYHTFTPLLYQVATCALDPSDVSRPVRSIFQNKDNVRFLYGRVTAIDTAGKRVQVQIDARERWESYDYLIIATGSTPAYFGNEAFREHALELRDLSDAVTLRNHTLEMFERAIWADDAQERDALTTIVIVGGGPTGLETAGSLYELYNHVLDREYGEAELRARIILVEMLPYLLAPYPPELRQAAKEQVASLGVQVILNRKVVEVAEDHVRLDDDTVIPTHTLVWAAGMQASPVSEMVGVELAKGGRIPVTPQLTIAGCPGVFAVGDIAYLEDDAGTAYPMLIPVAQQQGQLAARNILRDVRGEAMDAFRYHDRGTMATIGRSRAVAWIYNRFQMSGWLAWLAWLGLHLISLIGFRNRVSVLLSWLWNYLTYDRSVRIILHRDTAAE